MQRRISIPALLFSSISAILGSGWLFAAFYTARLAGPASLISWLVGGAIMIIIAFVFAELCAMLPITGSSTRIPRFTHGTLASFIFSWIIWLSYAALPPTEVQAVMQYMSHFFPGFVHNTTGGLKKEGYVIATVLMFLLSVINIYSIRWLFRFNNILTLLKIFIPMIVGFVILFHFFSWENTIHAGGSIFNPVGFHGILAAISTGGIVFAFNGFKQACELAGEAKKPHVALPIAIIFSIVVCLLLYLMLQVGFLSSMSPSNIVDGWGNIELSGANSPLASLVIRDHLFYLMPFLYTGAIIAPIAAALMYVSSASRSLYGMSKNEQIPTVFSYLTKEGTPLTAIVVNFLLGMLMFFTLPGWNAMVIFLGSVMAATYSIGPICLIALRYQVPKHKRPFKLPFGKLWSLIAFYFCSLLIYWCGWAIIFKLSICIGIGLTVFFIHRFFIIGEGLSLNWKESIWVWVYFTGLTIISYLGSFGGGHHMITTIWGFILIGVLCLITIGLAIRYRLPNEETAQHIACLESSISDANTPA